MDALAQLVGKVTEVVPIRSEDARTERRVVRYGYVPRRDCRAPFITHPVQT